MDALYSYNLSISRPQQQGEKSVRAYGRHRQQRYFMQILRETLYSKHELVKLCTLVKIQYSESHTLVGGTYMLRSPESVPLYPLSPLPPVHTRKLRNSGWSKQNAGTFNSEARFHPQAFRSSIHEPNNILKAAF